MTPLDRVCISTLAYYYALGHMAMTSTEVWQWQMDDQGFPTSHPLIFIRDTLRNLEGSSAIVAENGFYHIATVPASLSERRWRMAQTIEKRVLCRKKAAFLPLIPFVRLVRMSGSLATANTSERSDLDLSIGVSQRRLWIARALITLTAHLLGVRRWGNRTTNRLCFNHYTSRSEAPYGSTDPAFFHVERTSIPLWAANEQRNPIQVFAELALNITGLGDLLEYLLGRFQRAKIARNITPYPTELPLPVTDSTHLVFYHPRIVSVKREWRTLATNVFGHF